MLSLPPELLSPIFLDAEISLENLIICHALLPYTLHALLDQVDLYSKTQILSFAACVQDPARAALVRYLAVSRIEDLVSDDDSEAETTDEEDTEDSDDWESTSGSVSEGESAEVKSEIESQLSVTSGEFDGLGVQRGMS